jgi:hypothetical protein
MPRIIVCPKCKNKEQSEFGYPPCCAGEIYKHATCYKCGHIFKLPTNAKNK